MKRFLKSLLGFVLCVLIIEAIPTSLPKATVTPIPSVIPTLTPTATPEPTVVPTLAPTATPQPAVTDYPILVEEEPIRQNTDSGISNFYFAHFDVTTEDNVKKEIPNLIIRLHGTRKSINLKDISKIVLMRDGKPIDNPIVYTGKKNQFTWGTEKVTDFYFKFKKVNDKPGIYSLTGQYQKIFFDVYPKIIEKPVTDEDADPKALNFVSWAYFTDEKGNPERVNEISFGFKGRQNAFHINDLTDLKITRNGKKISYQLETRVFRYYEASNDGKSADTSFHLLLTEDLKSSGKYVISGKYKGVPFKSMTIEIPKK